MNRIILSGRLTKEPELKQTQSGQSITSFSIAVNTGKKDEQGNYKSDFFSCIAWGRTGEFVCQYFQKGSPIEIDGQMHNNNYTDKNGVKHYSMVVNVDKVGFAMTKSNNSNGQQAGQQAPQGYQNGYNASPQNYQGNRQQPLQNGSQGYQNTQQDNYMADYENFLSGCEDLPF